MNRLSISAVLNAHVEAGRRPVGPKKAWNPSNLGGCERKALLKRAGVQGIPLDLRAMRKMWLGDQIHHAIQDVVEGKIIQDPRDYDSDAQKQKRAEEEAARQGAVFLAHELNVRDDELHLSGRLDTLVYTAGGLEVWEYKSIHSGSFQYSDLPKPDHLLQLGVYLTFPIQCYECRGVVESDTGPNNEYACIVCGGKGKTPPPTRGRLIYWSKDDARIEEYTVEVSAQLRANVRETLRRLDEHWEAYLKDGTLPPVLELVQAERKTKDKDGRIIKEPFFYLRGPKAGQPKMTYDRLCQPPGASYSCDFFMQPGGCEAGSWPQPDPDEEPEPKPEKKPRGKKKPEAPVQQELGA